MVQLTFFPDNAPALQLDDLDPTPLVQLTWFSDDPHRPPWIAPPWTTESERWLEIDSILPDDHRARWFAKIVADLDLTPLITSYAGRGSSAYPPELLMRLVLFEIDRGCLSPAEWFEDCRYDDAVKWLVFGLKPSRSALYQFRDRVGPYVDRWNQGVLHTAGAEGRTPRQRAAVDGTTAASYASRHTPIRAKPLAQRCAQLDAAVAADFAPPAPSPAEPASATEPPPTAVAGSSPAGDAVDPEPSAQPQSAPNAAVGAGAKPEPTTTPRQPEQPAWMAKTAAGRFRQRQRYHRAQAAMRQRQQQRNQTMSRRAKAKRQPAERMKISLTDPDSMLGLDKTKVFRPLFNIQLANDLDSLFVLGYGVFADTSDANLLGPTLERTEALSEVRPEVVANDNKYASITNLKLCDKLGVTMYAPLPKAPAQPAGSAPAAESPGQGGAESSGAAPRSRLIPKSEFTWLPEEQTYRCPAGHLLVLRGCEREQRAGGEVVQSQYRCPAEHCQACPLAGRCTRTPQRGRVVKRSEHDELYDALRQRMSQPEGEAIYKLRKQTVERQIADLKQHRGLRQFRSFGLGRARIQVGLLILAHNGLELLKARRSGIATEAEARQAG